MTIKMSFQIMALGNLMTAMMAKYERGSAYIKYGMV
jgi:hypothetical protein